MNLTVITRQLVGLVVGLVLMEDRPTLRRNERGLSQSAEIAILVGGVAVIAAGIVTFLGPWIAGKLPK